MELLHFFPLPTPSNIYGLAHLKNGGIDGSKGKCRILVSTLDKQVFCIEHVNNRFVCNEIHFSYIPSKFFDVPHKMLNELFSFIADGADIISIDSFERSQNVNDTVIGITFKNSTKDNSDHDQNCDFRKKIVVDQYQERSSRQNFSTSSPLSTSRKELKSSGGSSSSLSKTKDGQQESVASSHYYFNVYSSSISVASNRSFDLNQIARMLHSPNVQTKLM